MVLPPLLLAAALTAAPSGPRAAEPGNLLQGPARCVLRYLEAVRLAGPRGGARPAAARERDYADARALTAPRTLAEISARAARGERHPLAPWQDASGGAVLESFQLLAVRRAPLGAAIVTVRERHWDSARAAEGLARSVSEYLVARVGGAWRVVDRRPGGAFDDAAVVERYGGAFDDPEAATTRASARRPGPSSGAGADSRGPDLPRYTP